MQSTSNKGERLMRRPAVEDATGLPEGTLYQFIAEGRFPKPIKISARRRMARKRSAGLDTRQDRRGGPMTKKRKKRESSPTIFDPRQIDLIESIADRNKREGFALLDAAIAEALGLSEVRKT